MRICYLANAQSVHTQRWAGFFAQRGHDVHLISLREASAEQVPAGVRLHPLRVLRRRGGRPFPPGLRELVGVANLVSVVGQVRRIVGRLAPDIVHAHSASDNGFFAAMAGCRPLVLTAWGSDILIAPERSPLYRWAVRQALRRAQAITCDAEHLARRMVALGADPVRIQIVYFGTDVQRFSPQQRDGGLWQRLGLEDEALTVISLRSLTPLYDVESLLRAVPPVLREVPHARFIIAGDGPQRGYLEQLAAELGVAGAVRFLGAIPAAQMPAYLASADLYVSTALSDAGLAASTAEAMACALPVVITDFGENGEWVAEGNGGYLVPLRDPPALAARIAYLLQHEEVRRAFGQANRRVIVERNNREHEMAKVEAIYERLRKERHP